MRIVRDKGRNIPIQVCPPGRAEGAYFQNHANDRFFGNTKPSEVTVPGEETPVNMTLLNEINSCAMRLRDIITEGAE